MNQTLASGKKVQIKPNGQTRSKKSFILARLRNLHGGGSGIANHESQVHIASPPESIVNSEERHGHLQVGQSSVTQSTHHVYNGGSQAMDTERDDLPAQTNHSAHAHPPASTNMAPGTMQVIKEKPKSKQKPFSLASDSSKRSIVSKIYNAVVTGAEKALADAGRDSETPVDVGHILQHVGARTLNENTNQRGNLQALQMVEVFQAKAAPENDLFRTAGAGDAAMQRFELSQSTLVKGLAVTYAQANRTTQEGKQTRARVLSTLVSSFSRQQLNQWVFSPFDVIISRFQFKQARANALASGTGNIVLKDRIVRNRIDTNTFEEADPKGYLFCVEFVQQFLVPLAFGTRRSVLSTGEVVDLNCIEKTKSTKEIKALYHQALTECYEEDEYGNKTFPTRVPERHLEQVIETLSGGAANANQAALDSVYCKFGCKTLTCSGNLSTSSLLIGPH